MNEQEQLRRLRERQLADRDPQIKQKQIQRNITHRERTGRRKAYTLDQAWLAIPHVYRNPLICLVIGLGATFVLTLIWNSPWAIWIGLFATFFLVLFGAITGQAMDVRDNLRDFSKH